MLNELLTCWKEMGAALVHALPYLVYGLSALAGLVAFSMLVTIVEYEMGKSEELKKYERRLHQEAIEREDRHAQRKAS